MPRPTLRDVAREAGVSLGTASQALNNKAGVAPQTRARVLNAAASLGYQQPVRVALPGLYNLAVIGLLIKRSEDDPGGVDPFYSHVLAGAEHECRRRSLSLMVASIEVDAQNRPIALPPMLTERQVDGLLMGGTFLEDTVAGISAEAGLPIVLIDAYMLGQPFDSVMIDNFDGAYTAVSYLLEHGHTCIGLVGSAPGAYPSVLERRQGYLRALQHYDIAESFIEDSSLTRADGYEAARRLLTRAPQLTAIFACNDDVAIGVLDAALEMGRRVPDDLSLIGFDDIDLAQETNPPLTTMHVDKALMGALGVRQLIDRAQSPERPALTTAISPQLIVRGSVRNLVAPLAGLDEEAVNSRQ